MYSSWTIQVLYLVLVDFAICESNLGPLIAAGSFNGIRVAFKKPSYLMHE